MRKYALAVLAAVLASSIAAFAANTTFFTNIGDKVFPFSTPKNNGATPGTIDNMAIGTTTPAPGSFTTLQSKFGGGLGVVASEGNIVRQISSAGISPGATAADNVIAVYSLPASSFDAFGRGIAITAQGKFGATANNKQIKIIFNATTAVVGSTVTGGTTVADTGSVTTNALGWSVQANIFKYGVAASNTQIGLHQQAQAGATVGPIIAPSLITAVESGPILIAITGNASTATTDILFNFLEVNALN